MLWRYLYDVWRAGLSLTLLFYGNYLIWKCFHLWCAVRRYLYDVWRAGMKLQIYFWNNYDKLQYHACNLNIIWIPAHIKDEGIFACHNYRRLLLSDKTSHSSRLVSTFLPFKYLHAAKNKIEQHLIIDVISAKKIPLRIMDKRTFASHKCLRIMASN